ncbi:MAG: YlxR family protein [Thermomicrobiales bacterium]|nr:MAG: YlxR family protein [Thermomicrobiales bacterium]
MPASTTTAKTGKPGAKGPRPRHVPQRTCVVCREKTNKRALFRIVRTSDGRVEVDLTGRKPGRGAYVCDTPACWERATRTSILDHALKTELTPETKDALRAFAASIFVNRPAANVDEKGETA